MLVWGRGAAAASSPTCIQAQTLFDLPGRSPNHVAVCFINFVTMITCDCLLFYFIFIFCSFCEGRRICTYFSTGLWVRRKNDMGCSASCFGVREAKSPRSCWRCFYGDADVLDFGTLYEMAGSWANANTNLFFGLKALFIFLLFIIPTARSLMMRSKWENEFTTG